VSLAGHLIGVPLTGVHLIGVHLMAWLAAEVFALVVVLPAPRLDGRQCWVSASEGVLGVVERAVALVVMIPVRRRHPRLVRYSFTADFDSISSPVPDSDTMPVEWDESLRRCVTGIKVVCPISRTPNDLTTAVYGVPLKLKVLEICQTQLDRYPGGKEGQTCI
jgi:hypothetical protein